MEKSLFLLTTDGLQKLQQKYEELCEVRKELQREIEVYEPKDSYQADEADPGYISCIEYREMLDASIEDCRNILTNAAIIKIPRDRKERKTIHLGAQILVELNGRPYLFRIVGSSEVDPSSGKISPECPVGKMLMGKCEGQRFRSTNYPKMRYYIKHVSYPKHI